MKFDKYQFVHLVKMTNSTQFYCIFATKSKSCIMWHFDRRKKVLWLFRFILIRWFECYDEFQYVLWVQCPYYMYVWSWKRKIISLQKFYGVYPICSLTILSERVNFSDLRTLICVSIFLVGYREKIILCVLDDLI